MRALLLIAAIVFGNQAFAAKPLTTRGISYMPVFGYDSTASVAYTGSQGSTSPINADDGAGTVLLRVLTTTAAYIDVGANPNPSSAKIPLPANTETIIEVVAGHRVGAIQQSSGGTLYVTRLKIFRD